MSKISNKDKLLKKCNDLYDDWHDITNFSFESTFNIGVFQDNLNNLIEYFDNYTNGSNNNLMYEYRADDLQKY